MDSKISMAGIGERLKQAREKKSLSIDHVRKDTRIHSTVLIALEEGRCDEILTSTYVKSFLKKYSSYLGLDTKQILSEYQKLHPDLIEAPSAAASESNLANLENVDISGFISFIKTVVVFIVILSLVIFLGGKVVSHFKKARINSKASRAVAQRPVSASPKAQLPKAEPAVAKEAPKKTPLELTIKVKRAVLVQLKKDGVVIFRRVLPRNLVETFKADDSINIYAARIESLELTLNGKALGSLGRGAVKDLEITRKGVKIK